MALVQKIGQVSPVPPLNVDNREVDLSGTMMIHNRRTEHGMPILSREAIVDYLDLTVISLNSGLITPYMAATKRMRMLRALATDGDVPQFARPRGGNRKAESVVTEGEDQLCSNFAATSVSSGLAHLEFKITPALAQWHSHKGDPDPSPSVPHAHSKNDSKRKLDVYLGFIYQGSGEPVDRLDRLNTIMLWNDDSFRNFAKEALEHFIGANPQYRFRTKDPLRLPRKRRVTR